jgi:beta-glucosidase
VAAGLISKAPIDDDVQRILRTMFRFGLFDHPERWRPAPIDFAAHGAIAREIERDAIVLLRNAHATLPIAPGARSIAVIGSDATADRSGGGSSKLTADHTVSPLQGIRDRAGPGVRVDYTWAPWEP